MIRRIEFADVQPYASKAAKEGVSVKHTPTTLWFGIYHDDELQGFGGLILKGNKARVKGDFMFPENRGKGYGHELTEYRMDLCRRNARITEMEAYSLHPHYYERIGWQVTKEYRPNVWIVKTKV